MRNWCWGEGQEALLKSTLHGKAPYNWDLRVKVDNGVRGLEIVNVQIERKSESLQGTDKYEVYSQI